MCQTIVSAQNYHYGYGSAVDRWRSYRAAVLDMSSVNSIRIRFQAAVGRCSRGRHGVYSHHIYVPRNTRRAAEVWLGEYKEHYFSAVPSARYTAFGE
jgi:hypothetical protein